MRNIIALLIILLSLSTEKSMATHAVGADLTYVCMGGNNYRFFFTLYRDCSGIAVNQQYSIDGTSQCGDNISIYVMLDSTHEVVHTCSTVVTNCVNAASPYMGVEVNYFHGDVVLPSACNFWTFGLSPAICNRNPAITNLVTPNSLCMYVKATLNNVAAQCNNSPTFSNAPLQFLCANAIQYYTPGGYDMDGDSLTYQMITPHSDAVSDVQYVQGLTATQPIFYIDSTRFDPETGDLRFYPDGSQITVVTIQINEYRNGALIGSVERDIELIFENCTDNPPTATGMNGTFTYTTHVCADTLLSFFIKSNDIDAADQTFLSWDAGIPGATFSTSGTFRDTGYFQWQPGMQDIGVQPHNFTISVIDDACPTFSSNFYSFSIYVDSCFATGIATAQGNSIQHFSATFSPENHSIHLNYKLIEPAAAVISLYDLAGRELKILRIEKSISAEKDLNISNLTSGLYLLKLDTNNGLSQTLKVSVR